MISPGQNLFQGAPLQQGSAGQGIFRNSFLNNAPVTEQQSLWNKNQARQGFAGQAETEKALRRNIASGQSFSKTHQDISDTMAASGQEQAKAAAAQAEMKDTGTNLQALQQSATAQSQALSAWNQQAANQAAQLQQPVAQAMVGLGTGMMDAAGRAARQGFQAGPSVGAQNLTANMQRGATFNPNQMQASNVQTLQANVGKVGGGRANVGRVGTYQGRASGV